VSAPLPLFDGLPRAAAPCAIVPPPAAPQPAWPFGALTPLSYDVIMADPPWRFELRAESGQGKSAAAHYACLSVEAIMRLPVGQLARGDCWLWLWGTAPLGDVPFQVLRAWGFQFVSSGFWVKRGASGRLAMGTGYTLRCAGEPWFLGRIGTPQLGSRAIRNVIEGPRRQHSRKPDEAYAAAEQLCGPGRRADLFARQSRPGWEAWGHEATKFDGGW